MTTLTIKRPRLHPGQRLVERELRRFNVVCCGRRWGKTKYGSWKLIERALEGQPVAWFSPTYKMLADPWREVSQRVQPITANRNAQERRIELITGGSIDFWSLDAPDAIRGRKYARAVVDEAAMVPGLADAWQAVIRPTLSDLLGDLLLLSTPRGHNFFWQLYQRGLDPLQLDWACWQMPTSSNPYIAASEIVAASEELPERIYRQEYLAEFMENAGGVFRGVRLCATLQRRQPYAGSFVMGVDWAQMHDFTVLTVMDTATRQLVDMDRFNGVGWELQRGRLKALASKWKVQRIIAEANSIGGPNIEALQREGLYVEPFETTASSKPKLIESLVLAFEKREIGIFSDPQLIAELEAYERTVSAHTGRSQYSAPEGLHDDCVISLALSWYGAQRGGGLLQ